MSTQSFRTCAGCGAPATFQPGRDCLGCAHCDATRPVAAPRPAPEHPLDALPARSSGVLEGLRTGRCRHCGAETSHDAALAVTTCPYCTGTLDVANTDAPPIPAEGLLPFEIDEKSARSAFGAWLRGLWFRPSDLRRLADLHALRGSYLPTWSFRATADSTWSADAGYYYYEDEVVRENGRETTRRVQKTRWEPTHGDHRHAYSDETVSASRTVSIEELQRIAPFPVGARARAFDPDCLAGFEAQRTSADGATSWSVALGRIRAAEHAACEREVPGDTHRNLHVRTTTSDEHGREVLVPAWVGAYRYRDKVFRVLVNGSTGTVGGDAPWSAAKIAAFVVVLAGLIGAALFFATRS